MKWILLFSLFFCSQCSHRKSYPFVKEPIDVVIPCSQKDAGVLEFCIEGIRKYGANIRRIIVVSNERFTDKAEWFDEKNYPFAIGDLGSQIFPNDPDRAHWFSSQCPRRGWIYQQLLKLYAPVVIPDISSNVLVLDADVVFLRPVEFLTESGTGLYSTGSEYHLPYFEHMKRLLNLRRVFLRYSGICHHMLFQRSVIEDLFAEIRTLHGKEPWQALCACIDSKEVEGACMSEYEIYFNYLFLRSNQAKIRPLKWGNKVSFSEDSLEKYRQRNYDYVAYHAWERTK